MSALLGAALAIILVLVFSWVVFFGGIGAILARARGSSSVEGLLWGAVLGPIGWIMVWFRTRSSGVAEVEEFDNLSDAWEAL